MKKTTFAKLLALAIGVIIVVASLTAGFGAFADTPSYYNVDGKGVKSDVASTPYKIKPLDSIKNLDFEEGFAYWSGRDAGFEGIGNVGYNYASSTITLKEDTANNNKYLKAREEGIKVATVGGSPKVQTTMTIPMTAANASVGDSLAVIYDAKGNDALKFRPYVRQVILKSGLTYNETTGVATINASGGQSTPLTQRDDATNPVTPAEFAVQTDAAGWKTYVLSANSGKTISDPTTASFKETTAAVQSTIYLQLIIGYANDVTEGQILDACIDNIKIAKVKDGVYTDLATNTVIYQAAQGGGTTPGGTTPPPAEENDDPIYGTEADGFNSLLTTSYYFNLKPTDAPMNFDFSKGFKYWSGRNTNNGGQGTLASDAFEIVTEGTNKYAQLKKGVTRQSNMMQAAQAKLANVQPGDMLTLVADIKTDVDVKDIQLKLLQIGQRVEGTGYRGWWETVQLTTGYLNQAKELEISSTPAGWKTYAALAYKEVIDTTTLDDGSYDISSFQATVSINNTAVAFDADANFAVDNLRIAKVSNGVYTDAVTGEVIFDPNATSGGSTGTGTGTGTGSGTTTGTGTGSSSGTSNATGDSILMLAALFFVSGAGVFGTAKALKNR